MSKIVCPACDESFNVKQEDATLDNQVRCPECSALLEVIAEEPLKLEWIFEGWDEDSVATIIAPKSGTARKTKKSAKKNVENSKQPLGGKNVQGYLPSM